MPAAKSLKEIASSLIGIDAATEHKNKLLEFERNSEKRTKVIDDEMDYFDLTKENWLSNEKREELRDKVEQLHEDKFDIERKFELDFSSRQVVEVCIPKVKDLNEEVTKLKDETAFKSDYEVVDFKEILANEPELEPYYMEKASGDQKETNKQKLKTKKKPQSKKSAALPDLTLARNRLQNADVFESSDEGYALSISRFALFRDFCMFSICFADFVSLFRSALGIACGARHQTSRGSLLAHNAPRPALDPGLGETAAP